jgi:hypothetical protein
MRKTGPNPDGAATVSKHMTTSDSAPSSAAETLSADVLAPTDLEPVTRCGSPMTEALSDSLPGVAESGATDLFLRGELVGMLSRRQRCS